MRVFFVNNVLCKNIAVGVLTPHKWSQICCENKFHESLKLRLPQAEAVSILFHVSTFPIIGWHESKIKDQQSITGEGGVSVHAVDDAAALGPADHGQ